MRCGIKVEGEVRAGLAGLEPEGGLAAGADAAGCSGDDDVAGLESGEGGAVFDLGGDIEDHLVEQGVLDDRAVQAGLETLGTDGAHLVGGDDGDQVMISVLSGHFQRCQPFR